MKPAFEEFCLPTKKYADVIVPRGAENTVAIDLISQHMQVSAAVLDRLGTTVPDDEMVHVNEWSLGQSLSVKSVIMPWLFVNTLISTLSPQDIMWRSSGSREVSPSDTRQQRLSSSPDSRASR